MQNPRLRTRRKKTPTVYTYCPFRPGAELKARLDRVASRTSLSVSEIVRRCCAAGLDTVEEGATR